MNITANQTYTFKLVSGEEIVAKVLSVNSDSLIVSQPISMVFSREGLQMVPSLFSVDTNANVLLNNNSYSMVTDPRQDVADSYLEATTGIKPIRSQILTG
jgi:hypothetical protein